MTIQETASPTTSSSEGLGPNRLHHAAWVTLDSEATRQFYEDVLGVPLAATKSLLSRAECRRPQSA